MAKYSQSISYCNIIMGMRISQNSLNGAEKLAKHPTTQMVGHLPRRLYTVLQLILVSEKKIQTLATMATFIAATHFDADFLLDSIPGWCLRKVTLL